jgi:hypothetical protein
LKRGAKDSLTFQSDHERNCEQWDQLNKRADCRKRHSILAARRRGVGGVLAVYDGDARKFPAGSPSAFCPTTAAKTMAMTAVVAGASKNFSLSVVFACAEYETWLIAGMESLKGRKLPDGRLAIPKDIIFPEGHIESHGKRWLEQNLPNYRPTRDQADLTMLLDLESVRAKKLRSFQRLEHAIDELLAAVRTGAYISTPA